MSASIYVMGDAFVELCLLTTFDETGHDVVDDIDERDIRQPRAGTDHPTREQL